MRESPSYIEVVVLVTKDSVLSIQNFTYYCIPKISTWQLRLRVTYLHTTLNVKVIWKSKFRKMYFQVENRNCVQLRWRKSCPSSCEIIHHTLRNMKRMIRIRNPALTLEEGALILYSLSLFFWKLLFITLRGLLLLSLLSAAVAKNASASFPFSSRILG